MPIVLSIEYVVNSQTTWMFFTNNFHLSCLFYRIWLKQTTFWHNLYFCHEAEQTRNTLKCLFCVAPMWFRVGFIVFNNSKLLLVHVLKEAGTHRLARKVQFNIQTKGLERRLRKFYIQHLQLRVFPRWHNATETCCWIAIRNLKNQKAK